jgi:hypothetical protein
LKMNPTEIQQRGKIVFEGQLATRFWVRALDLAQDIKDVQELLAAKAERKEASIPIIAECKVDHQLTFVFVIVAKVDSLGLQDGSGLVYFASPQHLAEVIQLRDKMAADILKVLEKRGFDEVIEIEEKRESKRQD